MTPKNTFFPVSASEVVYSTKTESTQQPLESATPSASVLVQSLDRPHTARKLSSTSQSSVSRPSTSASKNQPSSSRSRSSSKERLLSSLRDCENAPQTSQEEDELEGNFVCFVLRVHPEPKGSLKGFVNFCVN